jgi:hypothetical protein
MMILRCRRKRTNLWGKKWRTRRGIKYLMFISF